MQQPTSYEIYLKTAYHLAQEARAGLGEFTFLEAMDWMVAIVRGNASAR